jgi:hypothetical protein
MARISFDSRTRIIEKSKGLDRTPRIWSVSMKVMWQDGALDSLTFRTKRKANPMDLARVVDEYMEAQAGLRGDGTNQVGWIHWIATAR